MGVSKPGSRGAGWAAFGQVYKEKCAHSLNTQEFLARSCPGQPGPRYTVLTGTPPFPAAPLSETYQNIRDGHYLEPTHLSPSARSLIARLLAPDPSERPSLDHLLQDDFFSQVRRGSPAWAPGGPRTHPDPGLTPSSPTPQGFTPERLPPHSCHSPPVFALSPPLGRLFRKVGQLLLTQCRPPCE